MLNFISPPFPHFIICGQDTYMSGDIHPKRSNIGVFDMLFVTEGTLFISEDSTDYEVASGDYLILNPNGSHRSTFPCRDKTHFYWLHFNTHGNWYESPSEEGSITSNSTAYKIDFHEFNIHIPKYLHCSNRHNIIDTFQELLSLEPSWYSGKYQQQMLFLKLLRTVDSSMGTGSNSRDSIIAEKAALYLSKHFSEDINYTTLSDELHFHRNYISLCMKKFYGMTPLEYLTRIRIDRSKHLLIHTSKPVGIIAEDTGFSSFSYFIRCFKKHTGRSPNDFRNLYR